MVTKVKDTDPRVKRTRQLLQQALMELIHEKSFPSISVQDIADRATVNRATFYAHFEDKYALMDDCIRDGFLQMLAKDLPANSTLSLDALRTLIQTVFNFFALIYQGNCKPAEKQFDPLIEAAVQQEVYKVLLSWLHKLPHQSIQWRVPAETIATVTSLAISGSAVQWNYREKTFSKEEMIRQVLTIITASLSQTIQLPMLKE